MQYALIFFDVQLILAQMLLDPQVSKINKKTADGVMLIGFHFGTAKALSGSLVEMARFTRDKTPDQG